MGKHEKPWQYNTGGVDGGEGGEGGGGGAGDGGIAGGGGGGVGGGEGGIAGGVGESDGGSAGGVAGGTDGDGGAGAGRRDEGGGEAGIGGGGGVGGAEGASSSTSGSGEGEGDGSGSEQLAQQIPAQKASEQRVGRRATTSSQLAMYVMPCPTKIASTTASLSTHWGETHVAQHTSPMKASPQRPATSAQPEREMLAAPYASTRTVSESSQLSDASAQLAQQIAATSGETEQ